MTGLRVENLHIDAKINGGVRNIVTDLNFEVAESRTLAIVGESGGGKTMTALALVGLLPDNCVAHGKVMLDGVDLLQLNYKEIRALRGSTVQYLPQSGQEYLNPSIKIGQQILMSASCRQEKAVLKQQALQMFEHYGLQQPLRIWQSYPYELSGGQAQRVVLTLATLAQPRLVIADEPTKGVDAKWAKGWITQIRQVFGQAMVIVITHDMSVAECADDILVLYDGQIMHYGESKEILKGGQPYTDTLIMSLPSNKLKFNAVYNDKVCPACRYSARCPYATDKCNSAKLQKTPSGIFYRCVL